MDSWCYRSLVVGARKLLVGGLGFNSGRSLSAISIAIMRTRLTTVKQEADFFINSDDEEQNSRT